MIKKLASSADGTTLEGFLALGGHIVNVTIGAADAAFGFAPQADIDPSTVGDQAGTIVTVRTGTTLEQLFEAILGNGALRTALGLDATAPAAARTAMMSAILDGEKVGEQIYEYNVADADEAPWNLGITDRALGQRDTVNSETKVIGQITWDDDGADDGGDGGDGGARTAAEAGNVQRTGVAVADLARTQTVDGHDLTITKISWTDSSGAVQTLNASDEAQRAEIAKRFGFDAKGQLVFIEERDVNVSAGDVNALRGADGGGGLLETLQDAYETLVGADADVANVAARITALTNATNDFAAANTALSNNVDGTQGALELQGVQLIAVMRQLLTSLADAQAAQLADKVAMIATLTPAQKDAYITAISAVRTETDTTVTTKVSNRLGNGEVYQVTVSVADDEDNSSEQHHRGG